MRCCGVLQKLVWGLVWGSAKGWLWVGCVSTGHRGGQHGGCHGAVTP